MSSRRRLTVQDLSIEFAVGLLFFGAMVVLALFTAILNEGRMFGTRPTIVISANSADGLGTGDPVLVRGVTVGRIESITLLPDEVLIVARFNVDIDLREDAVAEIRYSSVLGGRNLAIDPGHGASMGKNQRLQAQNTPDVMSEAGKLIKSIEEEVQAFKTSLENKQLLERLARAVENIEVITAEVRQGEGTIGRLIKDPAMYERGETALESIAKAGTDASATATAITGFVNDLRNGSGTLAKLINDDSLYRNANAVMEQLNSGDGALSRLLNDPAMYDNLLHFSANLRLTGERLNSDSSSVGRLLQDNGELYAQLNSALEALNSLALQLRDGDGTFARLVKDPGLYEDARQAFQSVHDAVDDFRQQAPISTFSSLIFGGL